MSERFEIPQARHRVVLVGVRDDISGVPEPLLPNPKAIDAGRVLGGLHRLRNGLSRGDTPEGWVTVVKGIAGQSWWNQIEPSVHSMIHEALGGVKAPPAGRGALRFLGIESTCEFRGDCFLDHRLKGTLNYQAPRHREDDLWRYIFAACPPVGQRPPLPA